MVWKRKLSEFIQEDNIIDYAIKKISNRYEYIYSSVENQRIHKFLLEIGNHSKRISNQCNLNEH